MLLLVIQPRPKGDILIEFKKGHSHGVATTMLYRLTGAGGPYQMVNEDRSHPPEFTIYQGDKKIGAGKFEFG